MSRSTIQLKELFTGIHLVAITDVKKSEGTDLIVRFTDGQGQHFDKVYDYAGSEFLKLCHAAQTIKGESLMNVSKDSKKTDLGARLWICIKEVWDVIGNEIQDTVNFYIFDTIICDNPEKKPVINGDPDDNKGDASGAFYDTKSLGLSEILHKKVEYAEDDFDLKVKSKKVELPAEKKKIIEKQKEMIKAVEAKKPIDDDFDSM